MRAVVQRCARGEVRVDGVRTGVIEHGLVALIGVAVDDSEDDAKLMAAKIATLRVFDDQAGLMNRSIKEENGRVLLVSQFTLLGDARKGRRPSFVAAAREDVAKPLYERVGRLLESDGIAVGYGVFGAHMEVELVNDGPVTLLLDTKKAF